MLHMKIQCVFFIMGLITGILLLEPAEMSAGQMGGGGGNMEADRISVQDAYHQVKSGKALLVCAYEKEEACRDIMLEGAITFKTFEKMLPELKKDQPIIFYCK